jgi:hypothetical protein
MCDIQWLEGIVGFLSGAAVAVFAEPVRQWLFRPHVQLGFQANDPEYVARTLELESFPNGTRAGGEAIYIRVMVQNSRGELARSCRGYLVRVERWNQPTQAFETAPFYDPVRLAWSSRGQHAYEPIDLPRGLHHFLDVVSTRQLDQGFRLETQLKPLREADLGREPGDYRLTIIVGGDNFRPKTIQLRVNWAGVWDRIQVGKT